MALAICAFLLSACFSGKHGQNFAVAPEQHSTASPGGAAFAPTHWTVILAAQGDTTRANHAMQQLCQTYWSPIYAFVRRQGHTPHDAEDLTQEFFTRLLQKNYLGDLDRNKGKFRSFLLASLKHFLANEWDKVRAQKRGGGKQVVSIDQLIAESCGAFDLPDHVTAEKIFDRQWAVALLDTTLNRLRAEYHREGKETQFNLLKGTLTGDRASIPYADMAQKLGTSESNVKVIAHRLRQRYRELLRLEIANTVATSAEVEDELRQLFAALAG